MHTALLESHQGVGIGYSQDRKINKMAKMAPIQSIASFGLMCDGGMRLDISLCKRLVSGGGMSGAFFVAGVGSSLENPDIL
jgi:hypothetical protein